MKCLNKALETYHKKECKTGLIPMMKQMMWNEIQAFYPAVRFIYSRTRKEIESLYKTRCFHEGKPDLNPDDPITPEKFEELMLSLQSPDDKFEAFHYFPLSSVLATFIHQAGYSDMSGDCKYLYLYF